MDVVFSPLLADVSRYPRPRIPMSPYLRFAAFAAGLGNGRNPMATVRTHCLAVNGRSAIALMIRHLGLGARDRVLLPAYHCPSMVEPFVHAGVKIDFYRVDANLNPDNQNFAQLAGEPVRLAVLVNYFGIAASGTECAKITRETGGKVAHDCAHSFYALSDVPVTDYAVASLVKFFAVEEGGMLLFPDNSAIVVPSVRPGLRRDLGLISRALEHAHAGGGLEPLSGLIQSISRALIGRQHSGSSVAPISDTACRSQFRYFDPTAVNVKVSLVTRALLRRFDADWVAERRRENYRTIAGFVAGLPGVRLLKPLLALNEVPYVVPILLDDPPAQFDAIRRTGIPLYRWEELVPTSCPISTEYRARLVQLPCHQDLTPAHTEFLLRNLENALSDG